MHLPTWPFFLVAWLGDAAAVVLIAVRTIRLGDGSYLFANPVACHQIAEAMNLPVLIMVLNNREWGAVRQSVLGLYPDGHAARINRMPLTSLEPTPDFTLVARASRAWTASVHQAAELPAGLAAAIRHVTTARTQALIEIRVAP